MYEVDRMNYPLADDLNDFLPPEWSERVNAAIDRHANQARIVELDSGSRKKLKSLIEEMFNLYLELFYEFWNDESCDPSTLISDELLGVLMAYNNSLNSRREAKNGSNEAIDVALSTYDQLMSDNEMNSTNDTLHTTLKVLQLLTDDINRMQSSCINNTNITDYHYCFYFYNSEVLQMTSAADVASFNAIVADSAQKPGAYDSLQKQFRLSATQGLPTVLAAALLKKNFLAQREAFEAKNLWQSAISPFLNWLNSELYVTKACPSVVGICTNIKQRSKDINLASTLTFNSSAFNLADFVRYYSVDAHYEVLGKMITDLSANLSGLKTSYSNFLSRKSIATINIYYRSFSVQNVVQTSTYNVWTFLSDIGGTMGLYLGATLLTFFEVIAFFVHGEETITKANMEARQRAPEAYEPKLNGHMRSVRWEQTGWPRYITFNDPSAPTINRWLSRRRSS
uniref:Uncharacterized protein n=1 Tax=Plectus sambesii TaxID=2011161 RepID=A0A914WGT2_9BILA